VLWELLAGKRLFARDNPAATLLAVMSATIPPVSSLRDDTGGAWDAFFDRALAREIDRRFASAPEMLAALDAIASTQKSGDAATKLGALVEELSSAQTATPHDAPDADAQETVAYITGSASRR